MLQRRASNIGKNDRLRLTFGFSYDTSLEFILLTMAFLATFRLTTTAAAAALVSSTAYAMFEPEETAGLRGAGGDEAPRFPMLAEKLNLPWESVYKYHQESQGQDEVLYNFVGSFEFDGIDDEEKVKTTLVRAAHWHNLHAVDETVDRIGLFFMYKPEVTGCSMRLHCFGLLSAMDDESESPLCRHFSRDDGSMEIDIKVSSDEEWKVWKEKLDMEDTTSFITLEMDSSNADGTPCRYAIESLAKTIAFQPQMKRGGITSMFQKRKVPFDKLSYPEMFVPKPVLIVDEEESEYKEWPAADVAEEDNGSTADDESHDGNQGPLII